MGHRLSGRGRHPPLATFGTKREAEDFLAKTIPEVRQRKRAVVPVTITVAAYADRWLHLIASTLKPRTLASYAGMLRLHLLPAFGAWRVQHLEKGTLKACSLRSCRRGSPAIRSAFFMRRYGPVSARRWTMA